MIGSLGIGKILIVLLIVLILFGNKLPGFMEGCGKAIRNFKKETKDIMNGIKEKTGR
jgi:sec-independent protein translocase protein TatA